MFFDFVTILMLNIPKLGRLATLEVTQGLSLTLDLAPDLGT